MSHKNKFVDFLRHYGPIPASDNMYDELILSEIKKYDIHPPIHIELAKLDEVLSAIESKNPQNVILTGTAGDGKTYHCRLIWKKLGGDKEPWERGDKMFSIPLRQSSRTLKIVKDMSELTDSQKDELMPELAQSVRGENPNMVFLVAANDGQLLSTWRAWSEKQNDEIEWETFKRVENMLVEGHSTDKELCLNLHNLSQLDASKHFEMLAEEILNHPKWSDCKGCELFNKDGTTSCPIRINRDLLIGKENGSLFRTRISEILKLARANSMHLPIRDLILLCVNILLGDQKESSKNVLLNCSRAKERAGKKEYWLTNPYANVFGSNLKPRRRQQYQIFKTLEAFGIGRETDNLFDNLLIYGGYENSKDYDKLIKNDSIYGSSSFQYLLRDYLEGERKDTRNFMLALTQQRQRLFFTLSPGEHYNPWHLTVFHSSDKFLAAIDDLKKGEISPNTHTTLIKGLNRTFCGIMLDETKFLYFSVSGGDSRGRIAKIFKYEVLARKHKLYPYVDFKLNDNKSALELQIILPSKDDSPIETIQLQLTHFEYLCRVAEGSLPASFSRQCHEDFLDFKLRAIKRLDEELLEDKTSSSKLVSLLSLSVDERGKAQRDEINILLNE